MRAGVRGQLVGQKYSPALSRVVPQEVAGTFQ